MDLKTLITILISKTENNKLNWRASNSMGRYEVDLKNGAVAIDCSFNPQDMYYRLVLLGKTGNISKIYRFSEKAVSYKTIEKLYNLVNGKYNDEFIQRIIDDI